MISVILGSSLMGRWSYSSRQEADGLRQVNVSFLKKHSYFNYGWRSGTITWSRSGERTGDISLQSFIDEGKLSYEYTPAFQLLSEAVRATNGSKVAAWGKNGDGIFEPVKGTDITHQKGDFYPLRPSLLPG